MRTLTPLILLCGAIAAISAQTVAQKGPVKVTMLAAPEKQLKFEVMVPAMRAMVPEQFPEVRRERTLAVFEFDPAGAETRVTLTQSGWKQGKDWDDAYAYLADVNAELLTQLRDRFVNGPMNWNRAEGN
jgi:hypothetical protein